MLQSQVAFVSRECIFSSPDATKQLEISEWNTHRTRDLTEAVSFPHRSTHHTYKLLYNKSAKLVHNVYKNVLDSIVWNVI